jgi:transcription attenuation protein (tryptophan RNA-binding attenuator protein)
MRAVPVMLAHCGEILFAQFTEQTSAIKIRGKAKVFCRYGVIEAESRQGGHT